MGLLRSRKRNKNANTNNSRTVLSSVNRAYFATHVTVQSCLLRNLQEIVRLDFTNANAAATRINNDVKAATQGEIDRLVDASDVKNAEFVLMNAVYFRGTWQTVFPAENTALATFRASKHMAQGLVPMMRVVAKFNFGEFESACFSKKYLMLHNNKTTDL